MAVAVYVFVVVKNNDNKVDITESYEKVFKNYGVDKESTEMVDLVQSSVSNFTVVKWKKVFVSWKTFFLSKNILSKNVIIYQIRIVFVQLHCCGIHSWKDFIQHTIPPSCCGLAEGQTCSSNDVYKVGCVEELKQAISKAGTILGSLAIAIAGVEVNIFLSLYSVNIALVVNKTSEPYLCRFSRYFIISSVFYVYVQHKV